MIDYICIYCGREFEFPERIRYCPFCGKALDYGESKDFESWKRKREAVRDAKTVELFSDITESLDAIRHEIGTYTDGMLNKALREIRVKEGYTEAYDFSRVMEECLSAKNTESFFEKAGESLDGLEKRIRMVSKRSDDAVEFGDFYQVLEILDETYSQLLEFFRQFAEADLPEEFAVFPQIPPDWEIRVRSAAKNAGGMSDAFEGASADGFMDDSMGDYEDVFIDVTKEASEEACINVLELLRQLLAKLQQYVVDNHLYFNYFGDAEQVQEDFEENISETEAMLLRGLDRSLTFDFLEDDHGYEELLSVFWNGFYQLSVYGEKIVEVKYFCDGKFYDPKKFIAMRIKKHYGTMFEQLMGAEKSMKDEGAWAVREYLIKGVKPIMDAAREREA